MQREQNRPTSNYQNGGLDQLIYQHNEVERNIQENHAEIKLLNNKIIKSDYDHTLLHKLETKHQALLNKRRELEEIVKNHQYLQNQINHQKSFEHNFKHNLGSQYVQLVEQKKRKASDEKRRQIEQERQMHKYHKNLMEEQYIRRKQIMQEQKRQAQEELAMREQVRARQRQEVQRQKDEYNKKVMIRNQIQTQKDSVYKQYYNHFMNQQQQLENIYKTKAAVSEREREVRRNQFQKHQIQNYQQKVSKQQQKRVYRMNEQRDMLRSFLQNQINEKQRKKSMEKSQQLNYQQQVAKYQVHSNEMQIMERQKKKQQQKRYDEDLKVQTKIKSYSTDLGNNSRGRTTHNPITNPIDFKIGITNPYVIRQYEHTKQKYLGDPQLKLRNLAMVGSNSLVHQ